MVEQGIKHKASIVVVGGGSPSFDFPLLGTWSSLFTHKPLDLADEYERLQGLGKPFELQTIAFANITGLQSSHTDTLSPHSDEDDVTVQS